MASNAVRLQSLNKFTVKIRHATLLTTLGTGFVVSDRGHIITCYHVIQEATAILPVAKGTEVNVFFPQLSNKEKKSWQAKVADFFYDDDVVILQLIESPPVLSTEHIAILGNAELSQGNKFQSYGFRTLDKTTSGWARGEIMGAVEHCQRSHLKADPIELRTRDIRPGLSGAAVLDTDRNLVVGIICRRWNPADSSVNDDIGWAINAQVLALQPICLSVQDSPLPLRPSSLPRLDVDTTIKDSLRKLSVNLNDAPSSLAEWVGRDTLLKLLCDNWSTPECHITGLIGFGGEGKSSLARYWVDKLLQNSEINQPQGIFWWSFYEKSSIEEFLESALIYVANDQIDPRKYPSSSAKAHLIAALISSRRYLFILDGLEVLQYEEGDDYGFITSSVMRDFLTYFAGSGHESFCLITSRVPVLDLIDYITYDQQNVDSLSVIEGRDLLRKLGIRGSEEKIDQIVNSWGGHALALSLIGSYLVDFYDGKIDQVSDISRPNLEESIYERLNGLLNQYDSHLTVTEKDFLTLFSAFRKPVDKETLATLFCKENQDFTILVDKFTDKKLEEILNRLTRYKLLKYNNHSQEYTTHPLIRSHYLQCLGSMDKNQVDIWHRLISINYYARAYILSLSASSITLFDLLLYLESVYHACCAGLYNMAFDFWQKGLRKENRSLLSHHFGAFEIELNLLQDFFPSRDLCQQPQGKHLSQRGLIVSTVAFCLLSLGKLTEAETFFERGCQIDLELKDWSNVSIGLYNISDLCEQLGKLKDSEKTAQEAYKIASEKSDFTTMIFSQTRLAWTAHQLGNIKEASELFSQAELIEKLNTVGARYLYGNRGVRHADHLRRVESFDYAIRIMRQNLILCETNYLLGDIASCHRAIADLKAALGDSTAQKSYDESIKIARNISRRGVLIEALSSRGRWLAKQGDVDSAIYDLEEALGYAVTSGYRILEADIYVGIAWTFFKDGSQSDSIEAAQKALKMSIDMAYHWGKVDSQEILTLLS